MVDLSNLQVGDTVHLRCGGSIVVPEDLRILPACIKFSEIMWERNGFYNVGEHPSPFDIVAITPKPEPKRIKGWVNVYAPRLRPIIHFSLYEQKEDADASAGQGRIACVCIDVAEGEGLS